jgi:hypothetical protein
MGTVYTEVVIDTTIECEVNLDEYQIMEMISDDGITFSDLLGYGAIDEDEVMEHLKEVGQSQPITAKEYLEALTGSTDVKTELEELKAGNEDLTKQLAASVVVILKYKRALKKAVGMLDAVIAASLNDGYHELNNMVNGLLIEESNEPSLKGMHLVDEDEEDEKGFDWTPPPYGTDPIPGIDDDYVPPTFKTADELDNEGGA